MGRSNGKLDVRPTDSGQVSLLFIVFAGWVTAARRVNSVNLALFCQRYFPLSAHEAFNPQPSKTLTER